MMQSDPDRQAARRDDRRFGTRYLLRSVICFAPAAIAFWIAAMASGPTRWIAAAIFVALIAGWIVADQRFFRSYQCPQCGAVIRKPTLGNRSPGDPIMYHCQNCKSEWDTRLRESGEL
jgi:predicted RNA-binding Zn-ribbon protein involved in translation (DUF1610 family)